MPQKSISVVIPTLNEAQCIEGVLQGLQPLRDRGCEVILVDGGSVDDTVSIANGLVDRLVKAQSGRACQMNAGIAEARAPWVWLLHADSEVPPDADQRVMGIGNGESFAWGYFAVRLSGTHPLLWIVQTAMNVRVRVTHVATGDHGVFVTRTLLDSVGGIPDLDLMEDVALSKRLRAHCRPFRISSPITTSSRRWRQQGIVRTIIRMWCLRLAHFLGVSPRLLARFYRPLT